MTSKQDLLRLILGLALLIGLSQACHSANLLNNPGFESGAVKAAWLSTGSGTSNGWNYEVTTFDGSLDEQAGVWEESVYGDKSYHGGIQAQRFEKKLYTANTCTEAMYQDADVLAGGTYVASVWVRLRDSGAGFGKDPREIAELSVEELDGTGTAIPGTLQTVSRTTANTAYEKLSIGPFVTTASTAKVRFKLRAVLRCFFNSYTAGSNGGNATWDDCSLDDEPAGVATLTGTVIDDNGSAVVGATVTAGAVQATTGVGGTYTLTGVSGVTPVQCSMSGYSSETIYVDVASSGTTTRDFVLASTPTQNRLGNPDFESFTAVSSTAPKTGTTSSWNYEFVTQGILYPDTGYLAYPAFGPVAYYDTNGLRAHMWTTPAGGESTLWQDVPVMPNTEVQGSGNGLALQRGCARIWEYRGRYRESRTH